MIVSHKESDGVYVVTFSDQHLNLLAREFIADLNSVLQNLESEIECRVIVLHAAEGRVFSAGADLNELLAHQPGEADAIEHWQYLARVSKPTIVFIDGLCLGGGLEIALMADVITASTSARFAFPEITLGLIPGGGGTQRLPRRISSGRAAFMLLSGHTIDADTAYQWGLVDMVFDANGWEQTVQQAAKIAQHSQAALMAVKALAVQHQERELSAPLQQERNIFYDLLLHQGGKAKLQAFLQRPKR